MNYCFSEYVLQISAADSWSHSENASCGSTAKGNEPISNEVASFLKSQGNFLSFLEVMFTVTFLIHEKLASEFYVLKGWELFFVKLCSCKLAFTSVNLDDNINCFECG